VILSLEAPNYCLYYVIEIMTWKFIYTYRERCKTGPADNRCWKWSHFTSIQAHLNAFIESSLGPLVRESPCITLHMTRYNSVILLKHILFYAETNQLNALKLYTSLFSFTMAPTCFGKTMPSSGSDYFPFWATSASIQTGLLSYWCWSGSERKIVAPYGWHCFAKTCRSHHERK
jgi:hypothetical protein